MNTATGKEGKEGKVQEIVRIRFANVETPFRICSSPRNLSMLIFGTKMYVKALSVQEKCKEYLNSIETLKINLLILGARRGKTLREQSGEE
jgi:hypothetical protein